MLAAEDIFADNAAVPLEVTHAAAALTVARLREDMAFLSPKLLTVRALVVASVWEDRLGEAFADSPNNLAARLLWRPSRSFGRAVAQPAATSRQLQASRWAAAVPASRAPGSQAEVLAQGSVGHDIRGALLRIVHVLVAKGLALREAPES